MALPSLSAPRPSTLTPCQVYTLHITMSDTAQPERDATRAEHRAGMAQLAPDAPQGAGFHMCTKPAQN